jgi:hypothetical protein
VHALAAKLRIAFCYFSKLPLRSLMLGVAKRLYRSNPWLGFTTIKPAMLALAPWISAPKPMPPMGQSGRCQGASPSPSKPGITNNCSHSDDPIAMIQSPVNSHRIDMEITRQGEGIIP